MAKSSGDSRVVFRQLARPFFFLFLFSWWSLPVPLLSLLAARAALAFCDKGATLSPFGSGEEPAELAARVMPVLWEGRRVQRGCRRCRCRIPCGRPGHLAATFGLLSADHEEKFVFFGATPHPPSVVGEGARAPVCLFCFGSPLLVTFHPLFLEQECNGKDQRKGFGRR